MRLLIVGPFEGHIASAGKIALERGAKVTHVDGIDDVLVALRAGQGADLVMADVRLDIGRLCASLKSERFSIAVVAYGIGAETDLAVRAIRAGAKEYIPLPPDAELIAAVLAAVAEDTVAVIHADPATASVLRLADQVAQSNATVLITGESGTGKEVLARYLHAKSKRVKKDFISLNCAAIPENLLESELFGHEKGAFTGAISRRIGKFEEADGGTLLLDEISEMHPRLQAKLLRAVQEREIDRVGGAQPVKVDIRLLATSNHDLEEQVRKGNFREDLYFRLNVISLHMPPLRERRRDITILADHFLAKYAEANGVSPPTMGREIRELMDRHPWRGNVRELENAMYRAVLLARGGVITAEDMRLTEAPRPVEHGSDGAAGAESRPQAAPPGERPEFIGRTVADMERNLILDTLQHCLGNRTHTANILGISIRTLRNKLKLYTQGGIAVPGPGEAARPTA